MNHQLLRLLSIPAVLLLALPDLAQSHPEHACTWLGGTGSVDEVLAVAVAQNGDLVVAGRTTSADFPVTQGAFDTGHGGADDAFVARLSADCSQVLAATFLGGSSFDRAVFVHVAADGSIWVGGTTRSTNYPTTANALMQNSGSDDAFVARFDAGLTTLLYSTSVGNAALPLFSTDTGSDFAIDEANDLVYVFGTTDRSWSLPPTAFQSTLLGNTDYYLLVLDLGQPASTTIAYGTLFGGNSTERNPGNLTLEGNGIVTWSGGTISTTYPTTAGAFRSTNPTGGTSANSCVITRFDTSPGATNRVLYSTYFGGSATDHILHASDPAGIVHVLLQSTSLDVPLTANAFPVAPGSNDDAYYAQFDTQQSGVQSLLFSSRILAGGADIGRSIQYSGGKVAMFLRTSGFALPVTAGAFMASTSGNIVGFVMELDVSSQSDPVITYASAYGAGFSNMDARAMAYDGTTVALAGDGNGTAAPVTAAALQQQPVGGNDGFAGRLELGAWPSSFTAFGTACAGTAGTPSLAGSSPARLGRTLSWAANGLLPSSLGVWVIGPSNTSYLGAPLPASLTLLGAPGCEVSVAPEATLLALANSSGVASFSAGIPVNPSLLDLVLFVQHAQLDAAANALELVTSNGIGAQVRW